MAFLRRIRRLPVASLAALIALIALVGHATPAKALELDPSIDDDVLTLILSDMGLKPSAALSCTIKLNNSGAGASCSCTASGPGASCYSNGKTGGRKVVRCSDNTGTIYCYYTKWNSTGKCQCDGNRPTWAHMADGLEDHSNQDVRPDLLRR